MALIPTYQLQQNHCCRIFVTAYHVTKEVHWHRGGSICGLLYLEERERWDDGQLRASRWSLLRAIRDRRFASPRAVAGYVSKSASRQGRLDVRLDGRKFPEQIRKQWFAALGNHAGSLSRSNHHGGDKCQCTDEAEKIRDLTLIKTPRRLKVMS
jgi:hypothetical protein